MASVTLTFPELIDEPERVSGELVDVAGDAMFEELEIFSGEVKASGEVPSNRGQLNQSIRAIPVERGPTFVRSGIHAPGEASRYAVVMDQGRKPNKAGPPLAPIEAWAKRQMRSEIDALAKKLQAQDKAKKPRKRKGKKVSRAISKYRERATFLIARSVRNRIHRLGIAARGFVARRRGQIATRVKDRVQEAIADHLGGQS